MNMWKLLSRAALAVVVATIAAPSAQAQLLINNGGFEAGLASWTRFDQLGSNGTFFLQSGPLSPVNAMPVPIPPGGLRAAMTDAQAPGTHVLYQDFIVPTTTIATATLQFDLFVGNRANAFFVPTTPSLDFSTPTLNQQARVDVLIAGSDPLSVSSLDVLSNVYQTRTTDPLVSGYNTVTLDLTPLLAAHQGETLRLRFAEVDNVSMFQLGVDNVSLVVSSVPEPSSLALCGLGLLYGVRRWRRRRS